MKGVDLIEGIFTYAIVDDGLHLMRRMAKTVSSHLVCDAQDTVRRTILMLSNKVPPRPLMASLLFEEAAKI